MKTLPTSIYDPTAGRFCVASSALGYEVYQSGNSQGPFAVTRTYEDAETIAAACLIVSTLQEMTPRNDTSIEIRHFIRVLFGEPK